MLPGARKAGGEWEVRRNTLSLRDELQTDGGTDDGMDYRVKCRVGVVRGQVGETKPAWGPLQGVWLQPGVVGTERTS